MAKKDDKKETKREGRVWYVKGVNINYSFENLEAVAERLGAEVNEGDILIADNINGDKRKIFKKTKNGSLILYMALNRQNEFVELVEGGKGRIAGTKRKLLDYFSL